MAALLPKTSERLLPDQVGSRDEYLQYLRHVFAYELAAGTFHAGAMVLDLGCGEGYGASLLATRGISVVGVDVSPETVEHAETKYASDRCRFECYGGERLGFPDASFDAVTSFQVLEHVEDDTRYVTEAARVLKPAGRLTLTTPNAATRLKPGARPWNRFHLREYTADQLRDLLGTAFAEVTIAGITATAEIYEIEMARVRQARRIVAIDPLNLRRLIPEALKPWASRTVRRLFPRRHADETSGNWASRYRIDDYCLTDSKLEQSLDLLALCRR